MNEQAVFSGAIATQVLVGREYELGQIQEAINGVAVGDAFRCLLIAADGGKGKTRLLREVERIAGEGHFSSAVNEVPGTGQINNQVLVLGLVDVAAPHLHSNIAFLQEVRPYLPQVASNSRLLFGEFDQAVLRYEQARGSGASYGTVRGFVEAAINSFERDYELLTATIRVVWIIDTLEQLFPPQPEIRDLLIYELALPPEKLGSSTYSWLMSFILKRPRNTTLLLAGRPEPGRWIEDIQAAMRLNDIPIVEARRDETLAVLAAEATPIPVLRLEDFTRDETVVYIRRLQAELQADDITTTAECLNDLSNDDEQLQVLHALTNGNPILLALYIDLLVNGASFPEPFQLSVAEIERLDAEGRRRLRQQIDGELLQHIARQLGSLPSQALEYMLIMRRGLDVARLTYIWGGEQYAAQARETLNYLQRLSFVKSRRDSRWNIGDDTFFLHDELYVIYQRSLIDAYSHAAAIDPQHLDAMYEHQRRVFRKIINFCEEKVVALTDNIQQLVLEVISDSKSKKQRDQIRAAKRERRQLWAEILHYSLYLDPMAGFANRYFELSEQALVVNDLDFVDQLQSEIEYFFFYPTAALNRAQTGVSGTYWDRLRMAVIYDRVSIWTKRLVRTPRGAEVPVEVAALFAEKALRHHEDLYQHYYSWLTAVRAEPFGRLLSFLFRVEWEAWRCFASFALGGGATVAAITALNRVIDILERVLRGQEEIEPGMPKFDLPVARNRLLNVLGQCLNYLGYGYASLNDFQRALPAYRRADTIFLHTGLRSLHGEVKNNLSRILGELGALSEAVSLCDEGIAIHEDLGLDYPLALSYNTRALILNSNARPLPARQYADQALTLCRQLNIPRGIGLALIQLAESCRNDWRMQNDQLRRSDNSELIGQAYHYLKEAEEIFASQGPVDEPIRLLQVKGALGNLYRDWGALYEYKGAEAEGCFTRALGYYQEAQAIAEERGYQRQLLETRIDLAWLYKRFKHYDEAEKLALGALASVPQEYRLSRSRPMLIGEVDVVIFRELSKLASLFADIYEQRDKLSDVDTPEPGEFFDRALRSRILATVYIQLFSRHEAWYLDVNMRKLFSLIYRRRMQEPHLGRQLASVIDDMKRSYHLDVLQSRIGTLQFEEQLRESFVLPAKDLDYL